MRILLLRHAITEEDVRELGEEGFEQARNAGLKLSNQGIDFVYTSDLPRAEQTAKEVLKFVKAPVIANPSLREFDDNESRKNFNKRVMQLYNGLSKKHNGSTVLLVTHGGVIRSLVQQLMCWSPDYWDEELTRNCAILELTANPLRIKLLE